MRSRPSALSFALCIALAPVVMASSCGDKKKDTDENGDGNGNGGDDIGVESTLQVISIDPDRVEPDRSFQAQLFGSGFREGIEAYVGDTRIASVTRFDENTLNITVPPLETGAYDLRVRNPDGASHTLRGALIVRVGAGNDGNGSYGTDGGTDGSGGPTLPPGVNCDTITVAFDFDSYAINTLAMSSLNNAVACFTAGSGSVRVEGHCDERGTTEYNLALGQRRAEAVQRWLTAQGVPPSRLRTVSFGEERPVDKGHGESSWARNRRVELRVSR